MRRRVTAKPVVCAALVLAWAAGALMVADLLDADGAGSTAVTTVQVALALVALACGLIMLWRAEHPTDDTIIDLRADAPAPARGVRATTEARAAAVH